MAAGFAGWQPRSPAARITASSLRAARAPRKRRTHHETRQLLTAAIPKWLLYTFKSFIYYILILSKPGFKNSGRKQLKSLAESETSL
jgi:hypothetical protein